MTTKGIEAVYLETHNWGKAAGFFQSLGFTLDFETDHNSGQLRAGDGPYVFIAEVPEDQETRTQIVLKVGSADSVAGRRDRRSVGGDAFRHAGNDGPRSGRPQLDASGRRHVSEPDSTAVRVALWRALHVELDGSPHVLDDTVGLSLAQPQDGWRERPDMHPVGTRGFRAWIVARARFVEDLVVEVLGRGVTQYVMLGAGLDTFAQRRSDVAAHLAVFEVDQPDAQAWKRQRLVDAGMASRTGCSWCRSISNVPMVGPSCRPRDSTAPSRLS